ncbi:hypothetical protein BUE93_03825 [Chromobacterium amazonense]|uniref:histidine kinase n=1 Tax=Chromobacterium amazonense TaxID=1382803 RepID=A0A2S9X8I0_9NEIS|nr:ATP-binding protein [Chromobacterium amazonense]PRP72028.1 hypothetical protein BUE93_03825 [Chromobacterium amazonense]
MLSNFIRVLLWLFVILLVSVLSGWYSWHTSQQDRQQRLNGQLALYQAALVAELDRYETLPYIVSIHPYVRRLLSAPDYMPQRDLVNQYLTEVATGTGAPALSLLDAAGNCIASSAEQSEGTPLQQNYSSRPYFRDAMAGEVSHFFGVGLTKSHASVFVSQPVRQAGQVSGVAVVEFDLSALEAAWQQERGYLLVLDRNGVVVLSSKPQLRFGSVRNLSSELRRELYRTSQYGTASFRLLPYRRLGGGLVEVAGNDHLMQVREVGRLGWRIVLLEDLDGVRQRAWLVGLVSGLALVAALLGVMYGRLRWRQMRDAAAMQDVLEHTVNERTSQLAAANMRLANEVETKKQTEIALRKAQDELVQSGKLVALGQMAAGVVHELNQPLSALRMFAENTIHYQTNQQTAEVSGNLQRIIRQVDKLGELTLALRLLASRQSVAGWTPLLQLREALEAMFENNLTEHGMHLCWRVQNISGLPLAELAAEQVIGNLIRNAIDAMVTWPQRVIEVELQQHENKLILRVLDSGPGLPQIQPEQVFEPFYTTKPLGKGLGLGLVIVASIVRDAGGRISAANRPEGGACFTVELPISQQGSAC